MMKLLRFVVDVSWDTNHGEGFIQFFSFGTCPQVLYKVVVDVSRDTNHGENITDFGAFVDIGVKQDWLVYLYLIANKFVKDPNDVLKLSQQVMVKVTDIDVARKRIQLSMKDV